MFNLILMFIQIVGSAPGFPHGVIDPIEVCLVEFLHSPAFSAWLHQKFDVLNFSYMATCIIYCLVIGLQELGELATKYDICLHVDLCLGGFVLPFARKLGYLLQNDTISLGWLHFSFSFPVLNFLFWLNMNFCCCF